MDNIDVTTVVFAIVAIFVVYKLRSVLGTRTGNEPRQMDAPPPKSPQTSNVISLGFPRRGQPAPPPPAPDRWMPHADAGSALAAGLDSVAVFEPQFDPTAFVAGARGAYEMIVVAFAASDLNQLRRLLAPDVYANFAAAIEARHAAGQTAKTTIVSIDKAEMVDVRVASGVASIAVRFASKLISCTLDSSGAVIEGSATAVDDHLDVWTFTRALGSRDPNWLLTATETVH